MPSFPVTLTLPVLWGDMDALQHVNNARYFTWFESARLAYFGKLGPVGSDVGPILASTSCDFLRPVLYPGDVLVGARVVEIGNSSLRMEYALSRTDAPDELCARGSSVIVLVRYATMEKVRVPDEARAKIGAMEGWSTKSGPAA